MIYCVYLRRYKKYLMFEYDNSELYYYISFVTKNKVSDSIILKHYDDFYFSSEIKNEFYLNLFNGFYYSSLTNSINLNNFNFYETKFYNLLKYLTNNNEEDINYILMWIKDSIINTFNP